MPIGKTWGNTDYLIFNENDSEVPAGETGQLLVRSATMMSGYFNQPELTAAAIYQQPSACGEVRRLYRTGDLVRKDADGNLHFLGRKDRQIKLRGHRIELDSIETILAGHSSVIESAVCLIDDDSTDGELIGFVTLRSNTCASDEIDAGLRHFLAGKLPGWSVPARILEWPDFPRTSNGKIDRTELCHQFRTAGN